MFTLTSQLQTFNPPWRREEPTVQRSNTLLISDTHTHIIFMCETLWFLCAEDTWSFQEEQCLGHWQHPWYYLSEPRLKTYANFKPDWYYWNVKTLKSYFDHVTHNGWGERTRHNSRKTHNFSLILNLRHKSLEKLLGVRLKLIKRNCRTSSSCGKNTPVLWKECDRIPPSWFLQRFNTPHFYVFPSQHLDLNTHH